MTTVLRYRLRFSKRAKLRFISHRDLMLVFERALRRAGLTVAYSQGFNPHPKLTFAHALALGVESHDEIIDIELSDDPSPDEFRSRLNEQMPEGAEILSCMAIEKNAKLVVDGIDYQVEIEPAARDDILLSLTRFAEAENATITRERKGRVRSIALKDFVRNPRFEDDVIKFTLRFTSEGSMKPTEFLDWLGIDSNELKIVKTRTCLADDQP